ncbi:MAG: hypothetical protein GF353_27480 [Candidatus Lokiarchaeota archaeon]|nr:hypothetical protein [Candidatus Lokiarchaeota archaeon]
MKLVKNEFVRETDVKGFLKDEILEVKRKVSDFKAKKINEELFSEYLDSKFPIDNIDSFNLYLTKINSFYDKFLINREQKQVYDLQYLDIKKEISEEIELISESLINLKLNAQNILRFLKKNEYLDTLISDIEKNKAIIKILRSKVNISSDKINRSYEKYAQIWFEVSKLKNSYIKVNFLPDSMEFWKEFMELYEYLVNLHLDEKGKKKLRKKKIDLKVYFDEIAKFCVTKKGYSDSFYSNIVGLLINNNIFEELKGKEEELDEYRNILDRKEIISQIESYLNPIIVELLKDIFSNVIEKISDLDNKYKLEENKKNVNLNVLFKEKASVILPKLIEYYLNGIEKQYQETINEITQSTELEAIRNEYSKIIEDLKAILKDFTSYIVRYEPLLNPYEEAVLSLKKGLSNIEEELNRRKEDYLNYLKAIKNERIRNDVRNFIYDKINEINTLMEKYQDQASEIVREELPQLKKMRGVLKNYKNNVQSIKEQVYKKVDQFREKDIDLYQIIKQWEKNFTLKRQQLNFLVGLLLKKLFKNFKELMEEEQTIFDKMSEITDNQNEEKSIPLNFALSEYLIDKLSEKELNERINEVNKKIMSLKNEIILYESELSDLETTLSDRVKLKEGIDRDNIQCSICRKKINLGKDKIVKCPFCDAVYHYLCVAFWLSKYNSCPSCQNKFLDPNAGLYEQDQTDSLQDD